MRSVLSLYSVALLLALTLSSCSQTGKKKRMQERWEASRTESVQVQRAGGSNILKMREERGTYYVPITINGIPMEFIFDTGASIISISAAEAIFLMRQGKLLESDILGTSYFSDATGTISEGTRINLREVQIGNKKLTNVEASVVHNMEAPLLLGQSALNRFGKVTIDYRNNQLTLE